MKSIIIYSITSVLALCFFVNAQQDIWQQTNGPETGRITSFVLSASGQIFAATEEGFIFRSDNNGNSWRALDTNGAPRRVKCLLSPDSAIIYAGTSNDGIYKSTDNGNTWTDISDQTIGMHYWTVWALGTNSQGDILLGAGGALGVYKSIDGGDSWTQVANGLSLNDGSRVEGFALSNSGTLYTSVYMSGVYMSSDNGDNWTSIGANLPDFENLYDIIYTDSSNLFVAIDGYGIYRTSDNGAIWQQVNNGINVLNTKVLTIAPDGDIICGNSSSDVYLSNDEGDSWSAIDQNVASASIEAILAYGNNDVLAGTLNQGIFRTMNDGISWFDANGGLINSEIYDLEIDENAALYAGTRNMVYKTEDGGLTWQHKTDGLPNNIIYDLAIHYGTNAIFAATSWGLARSTDGGETWITLTENANSIPENAEYNSVKINKINGDVFAVRKGYGVYRSTTNGDDWTEVNSGLSFEETTSGQQIAIDNDGIIYLATCDYSNPKGIYRSLNQGTSWEQVNTGLVSLNTRCIDVNDNGVLFAGFGYEGMYRSDDKGNNWEQVFSSGSEYIESLTINTYGHIFAGTFSGVMRSINNGETWHNFYNGFPVVTDMYVPALAVDSTDIVYTGTQGFGVYKSTKATTLLNPILSEPINNAEAVPIHVNLTWENTTDASEYELQVSKVIDFSDNLVDQKDITENSYEILDLTHEVKYFWRVRAWDSYAVSNWSDEYIFTTYKQGPTLTDPANGSVDINTDVNFSWNALSGAEDYEIQVATSSDFSTLETSINSITTPNVSIEDLDNDMTYYWRVRAHLPEGPTDWSIVFSFNTIRKGPELTYPPDNENNISIHINFSWNSISGATSYQLQISSYDQFTSPEFNIDNINDTKYEETALSHSQQYFWRVRAHFDDGSSAWSEVRTFSTLPVGPVLNTPENTQTGVSHDVTFTWSSISSAAEYHLQVSTDINFNLPEHNYEQLGSTSYSPGNLAYSNTYYWHVRAYLNDGTYTDWSEIRSFRTILAPINLMSPENQMTNVVMPVNFSWYGEQNATSYVLQLSEYNDFSSLIFSNGNINETNHTIDYLDFSRHYYWRVAGIDNTSQGEWSNIWEFSTQEYPSTVNANTYIDFPIHENPGDFRAIDYRLFGLPGNSELNFYEVFGDGYDEKWIAYYDEYDEGNSSNAFVKYSPDDGRFSFTQGLGFWVLNKGRLDVNIDVASAILNSENQAHITLHGGWNIITNPFPNSVPWDAVRQVNGLGGLPLYSYDGSFNSVSDMEPYQGYYIDNTSNLTDIFVPYGASLPKVNFHTNELNWQLDIILKSGEFEDAVTWLGISDYAEYEIDELDYRKPRAIGSIPRVYFDRSEWGERWNSLTSDIRPVIKDKEIWEFDVESPAGQEAILTFEDVANVPANYEVYLIDRNKLKTVDLRLDNEYTFTPVTEHSKFAVIIGQESAVEEELRSVAPAEFVLGNNYPNPFNPETIIPIEMPESGNISLKIYNLLGEEIRTLYQGSLETGRHQFTWDGNNQAGQRCPSGIYLNKIEGDQGFKASKRMILMK